MVLAAALGARLDVAPLSAGTQIHLIASVFNIYSKGLYDVQIYVCAVSGAVGSRGRGDTKGLSNWNAMTMMGVFCIMCAATKREWTRYVLMFLCASSLG